MSYNPNIHHRRSNRLFGYDYSQAGAYFVTICTNNRECLFCDFVEGQMWLNDAGKMVDRWYNELENKFPDIQCCEFVCMPNHVHFITINTAMDTVGADLRVRPCSSHIHDYFGYNRVNQKAGEHAGSPLRRVVQWFKTMTTNEYIRGVKQSGWTPFSGKLWQRNYWDHVIRDEADLQRIREYIQNNPMRWDLDSLNGELQ